jgi:hypothetical protein
MQLFNLTSAQRSKALVFVASTLLMLLLAWQLSFKTTASKNTFVAANQSVVDITELRLNFNDFEQTIPATPLQLGEFSGWVKPVSTLLTATFSHIAIPQSRAPPVPL